MPAEVRLTGPSPCGIDFVNDDVTQQLKSWLLRETKDNSRARPSDDEFMKGYRSGKRAAYFHVLYELGLIGDGISGQLLTQAQCRELEHIRRQPSKDMSSQSNDYRPF
jgi:hypothetical protein